MLSKYKEEYAGWAYKFALLGCTNKKIAELLDTPYKTFENWYDKKGEFYEAIQKGRDKADAELVSSLYKKATGYDYEEKIFSRTLDGKVKLTRRVEKHQSGDVAAAKYLLYNRTKAKPEGERWADSKSIEIEGEGGMLPTEIKIEFIDAKKK